MSVTQTLLSHAKSASQSHVASLNGAIYCIQLVPASQPAYFAMEPVRPALAS